jgi:hypothetical protein
VDPPEDCTVELSGDGADGVAVASEIDGLNDRIPEIQGAPEAQSAASTVSTSAFLPQAGAARLWYMYL